MKQTTDHRPDRDIYKDITDRIAAAIEVGADSFEMPWHHSGRSASCPENAITGRRYRGINTLALWAAAEESGFVHGLWATYRQWQDKGAQVRKGEKSTTIVFWKKLDTDNEAQETDDGQSRPHMVARAYRVFNVAQVDGFTVEDAPANPGLERIGEAEGFFANIGASIRYGGNQAFYNRMSDHIQMPPFDIFRDAPAFYATLGHETTHWSGAKSRLDRDLSGRFGSESYAMEELIAELGAAFLMADLGLATEPRPDHAAYIASWLKVLKNDTRAIFTAASKAQAAADYLVGLGRPALAAA